MLHAVTLTALAVLLTTPVWMGQTLRQAFARITHVYMATYLATLGFLAVATDFNTLFTVGFLAPAAAWLATDSVYGTHPWRRTGAVAGVVAVGVALYAVGYGAVSLVPAIGWLGAVPVLVAGYAGWAAYTASTRRQALAV